MIQESKFLGGDMEHTHLVKGLDFALLQKVSADITMLLLPCPLPQTHRVGATTWPWHRISLPRISLPGKGCCRAGDLMGLTGGQQWHGLGCNVCIYSASRYGLRLPARRRKRRK